METDSTKKISSSFILTVASFIACVSVGLFTTYKSDLELSLNNDALIRAERIATLIVEHQHLVQKYFTEASSKSNETSRGVKHVMAEKVLELEKEINLIRQNEAKGWLGSESVKNIYFNDEWRVDENLNHFFTLARKINKKMGLASRRNIQPFVFAFEKQGNRTRNVLKPLRTNILKNREYLNLVNNIVIYSINFLFLTLLGAVYFLIYSPWKKDYYTLERERARLQEVLEESEIRGNTFSWELNYNTKETKRSNQLSGIFEVDPGESFYLYDELSLFSGESQDEFNKALEDSVLKNEVFDIEVSLSTKNKKKHWLHYYAKAKKEGNDIIFTGTVRDITVRKLAEERFSLLFESLTNPVLLFGEGQIRTMNPSAVKFFGVENSDKLNKLHPAILFPLYQLDGRSSLEKLNASLSELKSGKALQEDWSFQTSSNGDVVAKVKLLNVAFPEVDLHLMLITDESHRYEFERRLVDANRRALHSRRLKLEYVTHMGVLVQELFDVVKDEIHERKVADFGQHNKLESIQSKLEILWDENINQSLDGATSIVLTDFNELFSSLDSRWRSIAKAHEHNFKITKNQVEERYYWTDSSKLKVALISLVESALGSGNKFDIDFQIATENLGPRQVQMTFSLHTNNPDWPGDDWKRLTIEVNNTLLKGKEWLSLRGFLNIIELLQGEVFLDEFAGGQTIGFTCMMEKVIGTEKILKSSASSKSLSPEEFGKITSADIWSHFGGDWDIIEATIKDFIDYYPSALADLHYFVQEKNSEEIFNVASDLYGVLSHFPFFRSIERIILIQKYSQYLKFDKVEVEVENLSKELSYFSSSLMNFLPENKKSKVA